MENQMENQMEYEPSYEDIVTYIKKLLNDNEHGRFIMPAYVKLAEVDVVSSWRLLLDVDDPDLAEFLIVCPGWRLEKGIAMNNILFHSCVLPLDDCIDLLINFRRDYVYSKFFDEFVSRSGALKARYTNEDIKSIKILKLLGGDEKTFHANCTVCDDHVSYKLPCGHKICFPCSTQTSPTTCPMCRKEYFYDPYAKFDIS